MRAIIQRVKSADVISDGMMTGRIAVGFLILLGIEHSDSIDDAKWLAEKIIHLRIFSDKEEKMNLSLSDVNGEILLISQFTLHASIKKGNRPSFIRAARPEHAIPLYEFVKSYLQEKTGKEIKTGVFGANMQVSLVNDGPVTIILDSKNVE